MADSTKLVINWADSIKFARDIDAACTAWGYEMELAQNPALTKENFLEGKIKEQIKNISRQARFQAEINKIVID
jgi:hypothetical protein